MNAWYTYFISLLTVSLNQRRGEGGRRRVNLIYIVEIFVLFFAQRIDDLSDFRERGVRRTREREPREERRASGAEPGENLSVFV